MSGSVTQSLMREVDRWLSKDTPGPLSLDLHDLERRLGEVVAPLEAIVGDLSDVEDPRLWDPRGVCPLCRNKDEHLSWCEWRRAVEWVRDTDQETT